MMDDVSARPSDPATLKVCSEEEHIEMAAGGCCYGPLCEWPVLASALKRYGFTLPGWASGSVTKAICQQILARRRTSHGG